MRPVLLQDVLRVARALVLVPPGERWRVCSDIFLMAAEADEHRRQTQCAHPRFGTGTLSSAAERRDLADDQTLENREFVACLIIVLCVLLERQA
jgi:hypothetical protein